MFFYLASLFFLLISAAAEWLFSWETSFAWLALSLACFILAELSKTARENPRDWD